MRYDRFIEIKSDVFGRLKGGGIATAAREARCRKFDWKRKKLPAADFSKRAVIIR